MVSKELQYGYSKGKAPRLCVKSFSSCFLGYWARVLLLRLFSFTAMIHAPHRQCPASCAKGLVRCFGRAFLHSASPVLPAKVILQKSKYDQCPKTLGNLSVFPQRTIIKFGAAGVCILAGFVVKYIQSIYKHIILNIYLKVNKNFLTSNSNGVIIVLDGVIKHARVNHTLE